MQLKNECDKNEQKQSEDENKRLLHQLLFMDFKDG